MPRIAATVLLALVATLTTALGAADSGEAKLFGLRVVNQGIDFGDNQQLRPLNWSAGTTLSFYIPAPEGGSVIGIDDDASAIRSARSIRW